MTAMAPVGDGVAEYDFCSLNPDKLAASVLSTQIVQCP